MKKAKEKTESTTVFLTLEEIKQIHDPNQRLIEYDKRILELKTLIDQLTQERIQLAKQVLECQEERSKLVRNENYKFRTRIRKL